MINFYVVIVCFLTAVINFIGIVSLSARIVGTRTKRLASSASIFNIIILISQFANTLQAPLLTKHLEISILNNEEPNNFIFRIIILSSTIGAALGAIFIPTIHRFMEKGVNSLYNKNSVIKVLLKTFKLSTIKHLRESFKMPSKNNLYRLTKFNDINIGIIFLNLIVYGFTTVSVLSCLYAGYLNPILRTTSLSMSGIANGIGAIGMLLFIEPYNAILTDKVIDGSISEVYFRRHLTFVVIARVLGTVLGQFLFIPIAHIVSKLSTLL